MQPGLSVGIRSLIQSDRSGQWFGLGHRHPNFY